MLLNLLLEERVFDSPIAIILLVEDGSSYLLVELLSMYLDVKVGFSYFI
jgi:hypothetical protein